LADLLANWRAHRPGVSQDLPEAWEPSPLHLCPAWRVVRSGLGSPLRNSLGLEVLLAPTHLGAVMVL